MSKRDIYIENKTLAEALKLWRQSLESKCAINIQVEEIPVDEAMGRITAKAVFAKLSSPFYNASAMDGIAVRFLDTVGASEKNPVCLDIDHFTSVNTGNAVPDNFDAVVMIEDVHPLADGSVEIIKSVPPWQHIRTIGEDIVVTELVLPEGHLVRPIDQGALLAAGIVSLGVRKQPSVAVIPTGSELVQPGAPVTPGNIIEFNSRILAGYITKWGGKAIRNDIVTDNPEYLRKTISQAVQTHDIVIVNAGASVGNKDFTAAILAELGKVIVHGVNIKPGKPVILAIVDGTPVIGLPGYPISAILTQRLFVRPLVYAMQGLEAPPKNTSSAILSRPLSSKIGVEDFIRVKLGRVGKKTMVTPLGRGAGAVMSLVRADGLLTIPAGSEGLGAGEEVEVELFRTFQDIKSTLVFIGSHDNILDVLANLLHKQTPVTFLSSAHVGSMGGIMAIKRGEAHLAGTHLLDEESGEYNVPFIKKHLAEIPLSLINLTYRDQGLLVPKDNPKAIGGFEDLGREDITFINRQRGAGTRILTDLNLKRHMIKPDSVNGYEREEYTHMNVASAVATGLADTGMGIRAAAVALGLDFIPVAKERYDLIIPKNMESNPKIKRLFDVIHHDQEFRRIVEGLGGYDLKDCGRVFYQQFW